jgi:hypothetical protein
MRQTVTSAALSLRLFRRDVIDHQGPIRINSSRARDTIYSTAGRWSDKGGTEHTGPI